MSIQTQEPRRIPGVPRPFRIKLPTPLTPDRIWRMSLKPGEVVEVIGEDGPLPGEWRVLSVGETEVSVGSGPNCFLRFSIRSGQRITSGMAGWIRPVNPAGGE